MYLFTNCKRLSLALLLLVSATASAQIVTENFDTIATLPAKGWAQQNLSAPLNFGWFQGNPASFVAYNGADTAYIAANYQSTTATGVGTISNWLFSPARNYKTGDTLRFYTRTTTSTGTVYPDRLQLRLSTAGNSVNAGNSETSVGDFTTLLLEINPNLTSTGYPNSWTRYQVVLTGLPTPTLGRVAFRYFVTDGGGLGNNSDYIGIDNFVYSPLVVVNCPTIALSPATLAGGRQGVSYNQSITAAGGVTPYTYTISAGALPAGVTLTTGGILSGTPSAAGAYSFTVRAADANGCAGTQAYSVTIAAPCPTATSLVYAGAPFCPSGTANPTLNGTSGGSYGSTAGLTLNATTGVISLGSSTPGLYTITYSIAAANGCSAVSTSVGININATPATPTITQNGSSLQSSAAGGYQWYFNGAPISGATAQTYAPTQSGNYTVVITSNNCTSAMSAAYNFVISAVSGLSIEGGLQVGPNPAHSQLRLRFSGNGGKLFVRLLDGAGRQVLPAVRFSGSQTLDMSRLAAGTYILEVLDERSGKRAQQLVQKM